jgi:hypothetical protein
VLLDGSDVRFWASSSWALSPEPSSSWLAVEITVVAGLGRAFCWKSEEGVPFKALPPLLNKLLELALDPLVLKILLETVGLACVIALCSVPLFDVKRLVELLLEKMPIPLKMFLSALKRLAKGLTTSLSFSLGGLSCSEEGF